MKNYRLSVKSQKEAIKSFLRLSGRGDGSREYINGTLEVIGMHYDADRAYVFEPHEIEGFITNSYEWCRDGVEPQIRNLQLVPEGALSVWYDRFMRQGSFYAEVNEELRKNDPDCYEILKPQGIRSIITAPLFKSGNIVGMVGVDNPHRNLGHRLLLSVIASSLHAELMHIHILEHEQRMKLPLQEAYDKAEKANAAKTVFLNNMSHDIRTPMNAIMGFATLMERNLDNRELVADYLIKIKQSGDYLLNIINNVLDIARIDSGKALLDLDCFDLTDKTISISMFEALIAEKHIDFQASQQLVHRYVLLDKMKVRQVMINLIGNAIKYTPEYGKVSLRMVEVPSSAEGVARIVTTITDNGIGMSDEFQKHVFEKFSRERNTTDSKVVGSGLGMSIVKELVELMGGTIELRSKLGKGTQVIVTFDHPIVVDPSEYVDSSEIGELETTAKGKRILLAEDNELNAEIATALLENVGLVVEVAEDGVECIQMLMNAPVGYYDLILMDIQMPNLNGYEASMRIRQLPDPNKATIPIVAMTANAFEDDRLNALAAGMNCHLSKPIEVDKLMSTLSQLLS